MSDKDLLLQIKIPMQSGHDFFINYDNYNVEAHLWLNPFYEPANKSVLWNLEIYSKAQNIQVLKLRKEKDGKYTEVFRDPKLKTSINTVIEIIETVSKAE